MIPSARLFKSRWAALLWAAGIVWTAIDIAQSAPAPTSATDAAAPAPQDAMGDAANADDLAAIANMIGQ